MVSAVSIYHTYHTHLEVVVYQMSNPWYPCYSNPQASPQVVYGFSPAQQQSPPRNPQPNYYPGYGPGQSMFTAHLTAQQQAQTPAQQQAAAIAAAAAAAATQQRMAQQQAAAQQAAQQQAALGSTEPRLHSSPFQLGGRWQPGPRQFSWPGWAVPPRR